MPYELHPKFEDSCITIEIDALGVLDAQFRHDFGIALATGFTEHEYKQVLALVKKKTIEILRGYVQITRNYRKVTDMRRKYKPHPAKRNARAPKSRAGKK